MDTPSVSGVVFPDVFLRDKPNGAGMRAHRSVLRCPTFPPMGGSSSAHDPTFFSVTRFLPVKSGSSAQKGLQSLDRDRLLQCTENTQGMKMPHQGSGIEHAYRQP